ncbi:MAG: glycosyltransferase family 4 protein [Sphingomonadales bacterium]|nr:glycosyltransferase family 4 protein [Sphingomonadales bacterium]
MTKYAENGASSRLRTLQYIPWLEKAGAKVDVQSFFGRDYVDRLYAGQGKGLREAAGPYARRLFALLRARRYDLIWIEKELFPYLPGWMERAARLSGTPYIVDYDDAIFHNYDAHRSAFLRRILGRKLDALLTGSAAVTAGNGYLMDYARRHGAARTEFLPTVIDLDKYPLHPAPQEEQEGERIRIGWIGTPTTAKYLVQILPQLEAVAARHPVTLVTIGAPQMKVTAPLAIEQHIWREDEEAGRLSHIDIGIMPLPDEPFERGKCGYKLIQYMACGRPVVASPVGVNMDIVGEECGLLASGGDAWLNALERLCRDADLRCSMGAAGRAKVEAHYAVQVTAPRLIRLMAAVMAP